MFKKENAYKSVHKGLKSLFPRLWRYCLFLTGSNDSAEDLAQSTCLRALERCNQFTPGTDLDKWAFCIAKNIWFNELRSRKVRQGGDIHPPPMDESSLLDKTKAPDKSGMTRDIVRGMMSLPEAQRIIVGLVYIEGYSYKEVSSIIDIPIGTVMSRLAAARSNLKKKYKSYERGVL